MAGASREPVYVISVAAELAGMHPQTLREYERKGLVTPGRTKGNTRRYSERDIERLRQIQKLTQDLGLNLAGASIVLELESKLGDARARVAELERQIEALEAEARRRIADVHRRYGANIVAYEPPAKPVPYAASAYRRFSRGAG